jgi:hypothetical protein
VAGASQPRLHQHGPELHAQSVQMLNRILAESQVLHSHYKK